MPHAVTTHTTSKPTGYNQTDFDNQTGNYEIHTATFTDGLGRPIQVKKTALVEENNVVSFGMVMQKPPKFDRAGRAVKSYHPSSAVARGGARGASGSVRNPWVKPFFVSFSVTPLLTALVTLAQPPAPIDNLSSPVNETTTITYDPKDRVIQTQYPNGAVASAQYVIASYNGHNQFKTISTDELGRKSASISDGTGKALSLLEPDPELFALGAETKYTYLRTGELSTITDPDQNATSFTYDLRGLWKTMDNPDTGLILQEYNKLGALVRRAEPNHRNTDGIQYRYDRGRLLCVDYPTKQDVLYEYGDSSLANADISISKGLAGRLKSIKDETGKLSFEYGALGEKTQLTRDLNELMFDPGSGNPLSTQYPTLKNQVMRMASDSFGRMLSMTYPDGERLLYSYDRAGNLIKMVGRYAGTQSRNYLLDTTYDKFGNKVSVRTGNNVRTKYTYDPRMVRLQTAVIAQNNGTGTKLSDLTYSYDLVGNPVGMVSTMPALPNNTTTPRAGAGSWTFRYDNQNRLTSADACQATKSNASTSYAIGFAYDDIHNITLKQRNHRTYASTTCSGAITSQPPENNFGYEYEYDERSPHRLASLKNDKKNILLQRNWISKQ